MGIPRWKSSKNAKSAAWSNQPRGRRLLKEIMNQLKSSVNLETLFEELNSLSYWTDGSGAKMAVQPNGGLPLCAANMPGIISALAEISALTGLEPLHMMVNKLGAGVEVPVHRDFLLPTPLQRRKHPTIERWHLPIITNNLCFWWDEDCGPARFPIGFWTGPVPYWRNHKVWNIGTTERIHLVIDLDCETHLGEYT